VARAVGQSLERRHAVGDDELRPEIGVDVALAGRDAADRIDHLDVRGSLRNIAMHTRGDRLPN
jgi:hypothetical protein